MGTVVSGNRARVAMVAESTRGTTPATPGFETIRQSGLSGGLDMTEILSTTMRADTQMLPPKMGKQSGQFSLQSELAYGAQDSLLAALCMSSWTNDVLTIGTTRHYITTEVNHPEATTGKYIAYKGTEVNSFDLTMDADAGVQASFGCLFHSASTYESAIASSTYTDQNTNPFLVSYEGAVSWASGTVPWTQMRLTVNRGLTLVHVAEDRPSYAAVVGICNVTGSMSLLFNQSAQLDDFLATTQRAVSITLTDSLGNELAISLPIVTITGNPFPSINPGALNQSIAFRAGYDSVSGSMITFTRTAATP